MAGFQAWRLRRGEVAEFLKQSGAAQAALIDSLFLVPADA
jgi:hypothetical protein